MKRAVTVEFDLENLTGYADEYLAALWAVAQLDPARMGDWAAGEAARRLGREITRRWLARIGLPMGRHKPADHYWTTLSMLARYVPPAGVSTDDEERWHEGHWLPRAGAGAAGQLVREVVDAAVTLHDALVSSPDDVPWRQAALSKAVEAFTTAAAADPSAVQSPEQP